MLKILPVMAVCAGVTLISGAAQAQDLTAFLAQSNATMQEIENGALRNTMNHVSTSADTDRTGTQGNVFVGVQEGQYNRIDATQTGLGNVIRIMQSGTSNSAVISQSGSYNQITLRQGR